MTEEVCQIQYSDHFDSISILGYVYTIRTMLKYETPEIKSCSPTREGHWWLSV